MIDIPLHSLVVLIGTVGCGKQQWAQSHFQSHELLSADSIRLNLLGRSDNFQKETIVWKELYRQAENKISLGSRVVIVATNLKRSDRQPFVQLADTYGVPIVFVVFEASHDHKLFQLTQRGWTHNHAHAILIKQEQTFRSNRVERSQFAYSKLSVIKNTDTVKVANSHVALSNRLLAVGDVHGDFVSMQRAVNLAVAENRQIVWLGDVIDYGTGNLKCVRLAYDTVMSNQAVFVWGNHERKIGKWIDQDWGSLYRGRLSEANFCTIREIEQLNPARRQRFLSAWTALQNQSRQCWVSNNWLFTHGAATVDMWHRNDQHRLPHPDGEMAYFGQTDRVNPTKSDGYPNRIWDWVNQVPANHNVVVGHDWVDRNHNRVVIKANSIGGTVYCIDTGNSKGGRLAALAIDTVSQQVEERYFNT